MKKFVTVVCFILLCGSTAGAITVDVNADGSGDYPTIQAAIYAAADGDIIIAHPGIYYERLTITDKLVTIGSLYVTTGNTDYITETVIDAEMAGHAVTIQSNARLIGLTIRNGRHNDGGGIYCLNASPRLHQLILEDNSTTGDGGGIHFFNSNSLVTDVQILRSSASYSVNSDGGGIYCEDSSPTLRRVEITNCTTTGYGGGLYCDATSHPMVEDCVVADNQAHAAGGIYGSPTILRGIVTRNRAATSFGGGLYGNPTVEGTVISENHARDGGGGVFGCPTLDQVSILDNTANFAGGGVSCSGFGDDGPVLRITDSLIKGNYVPNYFNTGAGGGVYIAGSRAHLERVVITENRGLGKYAGGGGISCDGASPVLINVTITNNTAANDWQYPGGGGGIFCDNSAHPRLINCIVSDNYPQEILFHSYHDPDTISVAYTDIQGGQSGIWASGNGTVHWLEGNIDADPQFVDPVAGDYSLTEGSVCVDAGTAHYSQDGEVLVDLGLDQYEGSAPDMGGLESEYWPGATWPDNPGPNIMLRVEEFGGDETAAYVKLSASNAKAEVVAVNTKLIVNGFCTFDSQELGDILWPTGFDYPIAIHSIELLSGEAEPRLLGHVGFKYNYDQWLAGESQDAYVFFHDNQQPMDSNHPAWWHHEHFWGYFAEGEYPVTLLIPPLGDINSAVGGDKYPVLFVHGVSGTYPYFGAIPNIVNSGRYESWQFAYPYDQPIEMNADLLGIALGKLLQKGALYGFAGYDASRVDIVAHSMGGLVSRSFIQAGPNNANAVRKLMMLGTPNHGSRMSYRLFYQSLGLIGSLGEWLVTHDPQAPAHQQMSPSSDFLFGLNSSPPPPLGTGILANDYVCIGGHQNTGLDNLHQEIWHQDDDVVAAASTSLLDKGIPLVLVPETHKGMKTAAELPASIVEFLADSYAPSSSSFSEWATCKVFDLDDDACDGIYGLNSDAGMLAVKMTNGPADVDHYQISPGATGYLDFKAEGKIGDTDSIERMGSSGRNYFSYHTQNVNDMRLANVRPGTYQARVYEKRGPFWDRSWVPIGISNSFECYDLGTSMATLTLSSVSALAAGSSNGVVLEPSAKRLASYNYMVDGSIDTMIVSLSSPAPIGDYGQHGFRLIAPDMSVIDPGSGLPGSGIVYEEYGSAGFAQYMIATPQTGNWEVRHEDTVQDPLAYLHIDSSLSVHLSTAQNAYTAGDTLVFWASFMGSSSCEGTQMHLTGSYMVPDSTSVVDLGEVALVEFVPGLYRGEIVDVAAGEYMLRLGGTCSNAGGGEISRVTVEVLEVADGAGELSAVGDRGPVRVGDLPGPYVLNRAFPNPFNPSTRISYSLGHAQKIELSVFDLAGRKVSTLVQGVQEAGEYAVVWAGRDKGGRALASGIYLVRLSGQGTPQVQKVVLMK